MKSTLLKVIFKFCTTSKKLHCWSILLLGYEEKNLWHIMVKNLIEPGPIRLRREALFFGIEGKQGLPYPPNSSPVLVVIVVSLQLRMDILISSFTSTDYIGENKANDASSSAKYHICRVNATWAFFATRELWWTNLSKFSTKIRSCTGDLRHKGAGHKGADIRAQGHKGAGTYFALMFLCFIKYDVIKETNLINEYFIQFLKVKFWKKCFECAFFFQLSIISQSTTLHMFLSRLH